MSQWISVKDRLPDARLYGEKCIVFVKRFAPEELGGNCDRVAIMRYEKVNGWRTPYIINKEVREQITDTVTHWQPLPEPPK